MNKKIVYAIAVVIFWIVVGVLFFGKEDRPGSNISPSSSAQILPTSKPASSTKIVYFSDYSPIYQYSAKIPENFMVEYVAATQSINIYDPALPGNNNLEKSQIFLRYFSASDFQTLTTVNILNRAEAKIGDHSAVHYEIEKKAGIANFTNQPAWRSQRHKLVDIRLSAQNPSYFYVNAYNPAFGEANFQKFLDSLVFYNDQASFVAPIKDADKRVTKKSFGTHVSPQDSPVQPEKFTGYHTGTDFETTPGEANADVPIVAICGGKLRTKQTVTGYGGLLVQDCLLNDQPIVVVYGHLRLSSIVARVGDTLRPGQQIGMLGTAGPETDGERKHLHLGIHKGTTINLRGYVATPAELSSWLDAETIF